MPFTTVTVRVVCDNEAGPLGTPAAGKSSNTKLAKLIFFTKFLLSEEFRVTFCSFRTRTRISESCSVFGSQNKMPLLSALEDFLQRSLAPLPTAWEKLYFLRSLREGSAYRHWGLEEKYGVKPAQSAIAQAHTSLCEELASTRLAELWLSAGQAAQRENQEVSQFLEGLNSEEILPGNSAGVPPEHVRFITANLYRVARFRSSASRAAA